MGLGRPLGLQHMLYRTVPVARRTGRARCRRATTRNRTGRRSTRRNARRASVVGCMLSVACRRLHAVGCMLSVACCLLQGCNFSESNMKAKDKRDGLSKEGSGRVRTPLAPQPSTHAGLVATAWCCGAACDRRDALRSPLCVARGCVEQVAVYRATNCSMYPPRPTRPTTLTAQARTNAHLRKRQRRHACSPSGRSGLRCTGPLSTRSACSASHRRARWITSRLRSRVRA